MSECIEYDIIIRRTRDYPVVVDVCFSPNVITNRRTFYYERYPSDAPPVGERFSNYLSVSMHLQRIKARYPNRTPIVTVGHRKHTMAEALSLVDLAIADNQNWSMRHQLDADYYERYPSEAETVKVEQSLAERLEKLERRVDDICNVLREPSKPKCAHCGRAAVPQSYRTVAGCKVCETCYRRVTIR